MSLETQIAESFALARPSDAARALETLSVDDIGGVLGQSELDAAVVLVGSITPLVSSRCLLHLEPARAGAIVERLPLGRASILLRLLTIDERTAVLSHVAENTRRPLEKTLRFPEGTAGALMEPRVASFPETLTVAETLRRARQPDTPIRYYVFVVDDENVLTGVSSVDELVSARDDTALRSIMTRPVEMLLARAGRDAIIKHPGWQRFPILPVVDEAGRLVGVLRYETFRELSELPAPDDASPVDVALALGELFWMGASGMLRGFEQPPPKPASAGDSDV